MTQRHWVQEGTFHITTVTKNRVPWCTAEGVPEQLLRDMGVARSIYKTKIYAFCILSDHMHMLIETDVLSKFVQSFKRNSSQNIRHIYRSGEYVFSAPGNYGDVDLSAPGDVYWQKGFHDERIRDDDQFNAAKAYIESNAANHDLVDDPTQWPWSSLAISNITDVFDAY